MCNFLSWVEMPDGKLYYLTDKEVYSEVGRDKLSGCKDNDVLGHGAIRTFYGLTGGPDRERRDFWAGDLPSELVQAVKAFDKHWGRMWSSGAFQADDLRDIICYAPEEWKIRASEKLLTMKPSNGDLCYIIYYAPEAWKAKASEKLLAQKPSNVDLRDIIYYAPEAWKARAKAIQRKVEANSEMMRVVGQAALALVPGYDKKVKP